MGVDAGVFRANFNRWSINILARPTLYFSSQAHSSPNQLYLVGYHLKEETLDVLSVYFTYYTNISCFKICSFIVSTEKELSRVLHTIMLCMRCISCLESNIQNELFMLFIMWNRLTRVVNVILTWMWGINPGTGSRLLFDDSSTY